MVPMGGAVRGRPGRRERGSFLSQPEWAWHPTPEAFSGYAQQGALREVGGGTRLNEFKDENENH